MDERQWMRYLALLVLSEHTSVYICVGCWYEQHPSGEAFPGDRVSSTLCQLHRLTLPATIKPPDTLVQRRCV